MKSSATPTALLIACFVVLAASADAERMSPNLATRGQFLRSHDEPLGSIYTEDSDNEDDYIADDLEEYEDGRDDEPLPWITYPNAMRDGPKFAWADEAELEDENDFYYGYGPKYMDLEQNLEDEEESYSYDDVEESFDDEEESDSDDDLRAGPMFKFPKFVKRGKRGDGGFYRFGGQYVDAEEPSYSEDEEDIDSGEGYAYEYDFDSEDEEDDGLDLYAEDLLGDEDDMDMYDSEDELGLYAEDILDGEDEPDMYEEEVLDDEGEPGEDEPEDEVEPDVNEEEAGDEVEPNVDEEELLDDGVEPDVNEEEPDSEVELNVNEEEPDEEDEPNGKDEVHVNRMKMMATAPNSTPTRNTSARVGSILLFSAIGAVGLVITGSTVYAIRKRKREGEPAISRNDEDGDVPQNELRFSTSTFSDAHDEEIGVPASRFAIDYGI